MASSNHTNFQSAEDQQLALELMNMVELQTLGAGGQTAVEPNSAPRRDDMDRSVLRSSVHGGSDDVGDTTAGEPVLTVVADNPIDLPASEPSAPESENLIVDPSPHVCTSNSGAATDHLNGEHLAGGPGNDHVEGGIGSDVISGGAGDDRLDGGSGRNRRSGGSGNDLLDGGAGSDRLNGGAGNDTVNDGHGDDGLSGGQGNDSLVGVRGDDRLDGRIGNDVLSGGGGNDRLDGDLAATS